MDRNTKNLSSHKKPSSLKPIILKPKKAETDFEELMKLAKQNSNQICRNVVKVPQPQPQSLKRRPPQLLRTQVQQIQKIQQMQQHRQKKIVDPNVIARLKQQQQSGSKITLKPPPPQVQNSSNNNRTNSSKMIIQRVTMPQRPIYSALVPEPMDDDYEQDDFVVDDEEDDARDELKRTLKSIFRYDKRRCDLREEELDRQYRSIGRVTSFEDLEREERRASRLAAAEDARAQREEEERKRLKKMRLKGQK